MVLVARVGLSGGHEHSFYAPENFIFLVFYIVISKANFPVSPRFLRGQAGEQLDHKSNLGLGLI